MVQDSDRLMFDKSKIAYNIFVILSYISKTSIRKMDLKNMLNLIVFQEHKLIFSAYFTHFLPLFIFWIAKKSP